MKIKLHEPTFGEAEIQAAVDVLRSTHVTAGKEVRRFERAFACINGAEHGIAVNSGSSANLIGVAALCNPALPGHWERGDEVIIPALAWSTTVWPLIQHGIVPVVVDVDPATFNIDPEQVRRAIGPKTRGIMPVHVYGNPCEMYDLRSIAQQHGLDIIEDCCEALGAAYNGLPVGQFGRAGTFSFYFSHHMTTLEGGMVLTQDTQLAELMRILRAHGWTRDLENPEVYTEAHPDIDPRFLFVNVGYNVRMTEVQAAIGNVQWPKLAGFVRARQKNTFAWQEELASYHVYFGFQRETPWAKSSCFGFPLVLKPSAPFSVREIREYLGWQNIETRPIICGNIARQPGLAMYPHRVVGDLSNATNIMRRAFSFGNHQGIGEEERNYVVDQIGAFIRGRGI